MAITGVVIAGGKGSRMGTARKPLAQLHGHSLIQWVIDRALPQVDQLVISVNQDLDAYRELKLPLVTDLSPMQTGPLLGITAAMAWYLGRHPDRQQATTTADDYLACFPADVPVFPGDLVAQLVELSDHDSDVIVCRTGAQLQPLFSLWSCRLLERLQQAVAQGLFGPMQILPKLRHRMLDIASDRPGAFLNINSKLDLAAARQLITPAQR